MRQSTEGARIKVWDPFVRVAHWIIVAGFAVAYLTEDELLMAHVWAGYIVGGLVLARVLWGFVGPRHARFSEFLYAPHKIVGYLLDLLRFRAKRYLGHSPAGGAMVVALLLSLAATVGTGLAAYGAREGGGPLGGLYAATAATPSGPLTALAGSDDNERRGTAERSGRDGRRGQAKELKDVHELFANLTLLLVILHVAGVLWASAASRENLAKAMITGRKRLDGTGERAAGSAGAARPGPG